ncbi:MAG: hypothetical protein N3D82_02835 [Ignisphaera sp.]|nr:hypothetical protein [Ignisphaera sp.]MCX8167953.1 hypothetical protein [Ignisphaera sp.]MDW8085550.1 RNA-binding domain-containing protein [Ignisphaera sp.]
MVYIRAEVEVRPTEDLDRVLKALKNILDAENIRVEDVGRGRKMILCEENDLDALRKLHDILRRQRILDTARSVMLRSLSNNTIEFKLNKQAAFQGVINFVENDNESPLGAITIMITSKKINAIVDWLAPRTSHGKPLWETAPPEDV